MKKVLISIQFETPNILEIRSNLMQKMNNIHQVIFNVNTQQCVVVFELAKSAGKPKALSADSVDIASILQNFSGKRPLVNCSLSTSGQILARNRIDVEAKEVTFDTAQNSNQYREHSSDLKMGQFKGIEKAGYRLTVGDITRNKSYYEPQYRTKQAMELLNSEYKYIPTKLGNITDGMFSESINNEIKNMEKDVKKVIGVNDEK